MPTPPPSCIQDDKGDWSAEHAAVSIDRMANADGTSQVVMLRHPGYPFSRAVTPPASPGDVQRWHGELRALANDYIERVARVAGVSAAVVQALRREKGTRRNFGWLPIAWGAEGHELEDALGTGRIDGRQSFWVARDDGNGVRVDRTLVLLGGWRAADGNSEGGEVGLRVVMHVLQLAAAGPLARVTGLSMSNLPQQIDEAADPVRALERFGLTRALIQSMLGFAQLPVLRGLALTGPEGQQVLRVFGTGSRGGAPRRVLDASARGFSFVVEVGETDKVPRTIALVERAAHLDNKVFHRDPAAWGVRRTLRLRRPTRAAKRIDRYRFPTLRLPPDGTLSHPDGLFEVRRNRVGNASGNPNQVQVVTVGSADALALRSDHLAAAHAYVRADELFERMRAYGMPPGAYFKLARLPLLLRHRAWIRPGAGDGNTVNAQVRPVGDGLDASQPWDGTAMPQLEVNFAAANLSHRQQRPDDAGNARAQHLGLAADPRWAWHEFGHVLNFARFEALEFRFAHSAGDALAAIVADPDSALADDRDRERCATFPWAFSIRRHDRDAGFGWCWCGRRNVPRLLGTTDAVRGRRFGYFEEQLLSSSLFRLYCSIGGNTRGNHRETRRSASDYVVYLIMRAIELLAPDDQVPAKALDDFVSALIDADIGTGKWNVAARWPEQVPERTRQLRRVGGCVHKVIRWAFEQQGLYATEVSSEAVEGIGQPPLVDIYIPDRRPIADGGYHPVPLVWSTSAERDWHASPQGIRKQAGKVVIRVGNRGRIEAQAVVVHCWVWPLAQPLSALTSWPALSPNPPPPQNIPRGAFRSFEFNAVDAGNQPLIGPHLVVASATCAADRSNIDPAALLPCGAFVTPLVDLIANDNNLGLRLLDFSAA